MRSAVCPLCCALLLRACECSCVHGAWVQQLRYLAGYYMQDGVPVVCGVAECLVVLCQCACMQSYISVDSAKGRQQLA
jgi:hypothetical protein